MQIALVSYINTRPFTDGLDAISSKHGIQLHLLPPADCAKYLQDGRADMALIPVGALLDFADIAVLSNFCIGADGPVDSVFIFAHQPIETIETLVLDRHSRSSNVLAKILLTRYWKKDLTYVQPTEKSFAEIQGTTAGVVIGDKALKIKEDFPYVYDLAEYWKKLTGLPFVFAVWAYHPEKVSKDMQEILSTALQQGVENRGQSALKWAEFYHLPSDIAHKYVTESIHYDFTPQRKEAMQLYLNWMKEL
jgi:chorismate dehydratase